MIKPQNQQEAEKSLAAAYKATARPDPHRGYGWCKYELFGWHIWYCRRGWACARLEDQHYKYHRYNRSLKECFEFVCTVQNNLSWIDSATKAHNMEIN